MSKTLKVKLGMYLTRSGDVVKITHESTTDIWMWEGDLIDEPMSGMMWTCYGGYSSDLSYETSIPEDLQTKLDLVKEITKENNPEYFL